MVFFWSFPKKQKWLVSRGFNWGGLGFKEGYMLETSSKTFRNTSQASEKKNSKQRDEKWSGPRADWEKIPWTSAVRVFKRLGVEN